MLRSAEFLGQPNEKPTGATDVAEPICILISNDFADKLRAAFSEPIERLVEIVHGKHDAQIAQGVDGCVAMIRHDGRPDEAGKLQPAVAVGRTHHGNLDALVAEPGDASGPLSLDHPSSFELEAELAKERDHLFEIVDH